MSRAEQEYVYIVESRCDRSRKGISSRPLIRLNSRGETVIEDVEREREIERESRMVKLIDLENSIRELLLFYLRARRDNREEVV